MNNEVQKVKLGRYRHFKGGLYEVIGIARHSETLEDMVVYRHLDDAEPKLWVRPLTMFLGFVERDGQRVRRFVYIEKGPEAGHDQSETKESESNPPR